MPRDYQTFSFRFTKGLGEPVSELTEHPALATAQNVYFDDEGVLRPRPGITQIGAFQDQDGTSITVSAAAPWNGRAILFDSSNRVYRYSPETGAGKALFLRRHDVPFLESYPLPQTGGHQLWADVASTSGVSLYGWVEDKEPAGAGAAMTVRYQLVDDATGLPVRYSGDTHNGKITGVDIVRPAVMGGGNYLFLLYQPLSGNPKLLRFDVVNKSVTEYTVSSTLGTSPQVFRGHYASTDGYLYVGVGMASSVAVYKISTIGAISTSRTETAANGRYFELAVVQGVGANSAHMVLAFHDGVDTVNKPVRAIQMNSSLTNTGWGDVTFGNSAPDPDTLIESPAVIIPNYNLSTGAITSAVVLQSKSPGGATSPGDWKETGVYMWELTTLGAGSQQTVLPKAKLASTGWTKATSGFSSTLPGFVMVEAGNFPQRTLAIVDVTKAVTTQSAPSWLSKGNPFVCTVLPRQLGKRNSDVATSTDYTGNIRLYTTTGGSATWQFAFPVLRVDEDSNNESSYHARALFYSSDRRLYRGVEFGGATYFPGAMITRVDETGMREAGFQAAPEFSLAAVNATGGGLTANATYSYQVFLSRVNAKGERERSQMLGAKSVTLGGTDNAVQLTITVPWFTYDDRVHIEVYRTEANPGVGSPYHRVTSLDSGASNYAGAELATPQTVYTDKADDASISDNEISYLSPADVVELGNDPNPGALTLAAGSDRLFLVHPLYKHVVASKLKQPGYALGFSDALTIITPAHVGPPTGIFATEAALLIFTKDNIFLAKGLGPNNLGLGGAWDVDLLLAGIGAASEYLVAQTPSGWVFEHDRKIYALSTDYSLQLLLSTANRFADAAGITYDPLKQLVIVPELSGTEPIYVYHLRNGEWTQWDKPSSMTGSAKLVHGFVYNTGSENRFWLQFQGRDPRYLDYATSRDDGNAVVARIVTAWIKLNDLLGRGKLRWWEVLLRGLTSNLGGAVLAVSYYFDYDTGVAVGTHSGSVTVNNSGDPIIRRGRFKERRARAVKMSIQYTPDTLTSTDVGAAFDGFAVDVSVDRSFSRKAVDMAPNTGGGGGGG